MTFDHYLANVQAIFDSFPNEAVWFQGGIRPNRQLRNPEAGYCIVFRYDEETADKISRYMVKLRSVLPTVVEYNVHNFHTTIGIYGKGKMSEFIPDSSVIDGLDESVNESLRNYHLTSKTKLDRWLFNNETLIISAYPNQDLWRLMQSVGRACKLNGYPLEMAQITHITTARFVRGIDHEGFQRLGFMIKNAPSIGVVKPNSIDLSTWRCDGLKFELSTHIRYYL